MPDGFMIFSILIADILEKFANCETVILGDITYGACCIDDIGCKAIETDLIIHYGHSCLVPVTDTCVKSMYVFVDIQIDIDHLIKTIEFNFSIEDYRNKPLFILGSIQYNNSVYLVKKGLTNKGYNKIKIPQTKPRSAGEVLGCTSPNIDDIFNIDDNSLNEEKIVIFICDGRFHMESAMIANQDYTFYQYNPFTKVLSLEQYDVKLMKEIRLKMISNCKSAKTIGIIFGILGRQGNTDILNVN